MGSLLESSKLVVASWLYRSWKEIPILMKVYFTTALVILMMLTSMGIFGYLSKAHLDQAVPSGDVAAKLALLDEKIKTEKDNVDVARKQIKQLDLQVDQTIGRSDDSKGVERSLQIRKSQQKERATLLADIGVAQSKITKLNEERAPIASEVRKVEAEVGPIKYIAALIYSDSTDTNTLDSAVRIVILLIVSVFDPLAVLLLIAANWQLNRESLVKDVINPQITDAVTQVAPPAAEVPPEPEEHIISTVSTETINSPQENNYTEEYPPWEDRPKKPITYDSVGRRITP